MQTGQLSTGTPQQEADATYRLWRDEQDYRIDWHYGSATIRRFVDVLGSYERAITGLNSQLHRVLAVEPEPDIWIENRMAGHNMVCVCRAARGSVRHRAAPPHGPKKLFELAKFKHPFDIGHSNPHVGMAQCSVVLL